MSSLRGVWQAVWGLLVEDGSLAIGIVVALAITWIAAVVLPDAMRHQVGWLLLVLLTVLIVVNLQTAGRTARGKISA